MLNYPLNSLPRLVHHKISAYFSDELSGSNCITETVLADMHMPTCFCTYLLHVTETALTHANALRNQAVYVFSVR